MIITVIMKTLSDLSNFKLHMFQAYSIKKKLERCVRYVLAGMKVKGIQRGGRILLGDNTGVRMAMLRPIRFYRVGAWIYTGPPY